MFTEWLLSMLWLSAFCLFLFFFFCFFLSETDFKCFKFSGDKVITNEMLPFSNLSGLKIILRICFKCIFPGHKYTAVFVCCAFTELYNHHHYLIPGHFYPPKKKHIFISSHSPGTPIPQPLAITAFWSLWLCLLWI